MADRHYMNPNMARLMGAAESPSPRTAGPSITGDGPEGPSGAGDGSEQSGYCPPALGPFECENCVNFDPPGMCKRPEVIDDPEVEGMVDPEGCCNFFQSAHNETNAQEQSENDEGESPSESDNEG